VQLPSTLGEREAHRSGIGIHEQEHGQAAPAGCTNQRRQRTPVAVVARPARDSLTGRSAYSASVRR
jgi:hypothetical protein